ncbi:methylglutaconyl-CoA hydratase, mitochondrial [Fopius arisanus]|uniref:Methylglutaconyl-CoA hydratase, mitochondrial n=1 Tax=Fopius arisanus TaxID=64838 RepID=A0A9R1TP93_9HYME|nr:PREDICTED: methylglutaconyl-CoA hydratase, mitochondrial [Fopius arisanus]
MIVPLIKRRTCRLICGKMMSSRVSRVSTKVDPSHLDKLDDPSKEVTINYLDGKDNGIAVLALNRPAARNSFGRNLVSLLSQSLHKIRDDEKVRVLILRSLVPKIFCAGADLKERGQMSELEVGEFVNSLRNLMSEIETIPIPSIAAIDGAALGGGLEMALAADIRTSASEAKMGLVETKLAIIPGAGGTQRLPRIVGTAKAKEMIFAAKILDGDEAEDIGLVNRAVPQNRGGDAAYQAALEIAREILPNGPVGVKMAKVAITKGIEVQIDQGFEIEKECYSKILKTKDRLEGLAAFTAKRVPIYRGM